MKDNVKTSVLLNQSTDSTIPNKTPMVFFAEIEKSIFRIYVESQGTPNTQNHLEKEE